MASALRIICGGQEYEILASDELQQRLKEDKDYLSTVLNQWRTDLSQMARPEIEAIDVKPDIEILNQITTSNGEECCSPVMSQWLSYPPLIPKSPEEVSHEKTPRRVNAHSSTQDGENQWLSYPPVIPKSTEEVSHEKIPRRVNAQSSTKDTPKPMEEILIKEFSKHRNLYDKRRGDFKNTKLRERSWRKIASVVGISVTQCQGRWKSLRERFVKEKKELSEQRHAPGSYKKIPWSYMEMMSFLDKYIKPRKAENSATISLSETDSSTHSFYPCEIASPPLSPSSESAVEVGSSQNYPETLINVRTVNPAIPELLIETSDLESSKLRKRSNTIERELLKTVSHLTEVLETKNSQKSENSLFGEFIAAKLNAVNVKKSNEMKLKIMQILCE